MVIAKKNGPEMGLFYGACAVQLKGVGLLAKQHTHFFISICQG